MNQEQASQRRAAQSYSTSSLAGSRRKFPSSHHSKSYNGNLRDFLARTAPPELLDLPNVRRTYILDGIDEAPIDYRAAIPPQIKDLLTTDGTARLILTSRQAFAAQHPEAFPPEVVTYHLLDFNDNDIRACALQRGIDADDWPKFGRLTAKKRSATLSCSR